MFYSKSKGRRRRAPALGQIGGGGGKRRRFAPFSVGEAAAVRIDGDELSTATTTTTTATATTSAGKTRRPYGYDAAEIRTIQPRKGDAESLVVDDDGEFGRGFWPRSLFLLRKPNRLVTDTH